MYYYPQLQKKETCNQMCFAQDQRRSLHKVNNYCDQNPDRDYNTAWQVQRQVRTFPRTKVQELISKKQYWKPKKFWKTAYFPMQTLLIHTRNFSLTQNSVNHSNGLQHDESFTIKFRLLYFKKYIFFYSRRYILISDIRKQTWKMLERVPPMNSEEIQ